MKLSLKDDKSKEIKPITTVEEGDNWSIITKIIEARELHFITFSPTLNNILTTFSFNIK